MARGCAPAAAAYSLAAPVSAGPAPYAAIWGETMNKKFIIAWIVLFVAWFVGSFVVHGVLLRSDYMQLTKLFRAEGDQQKYFPLMLLAHVILSGAFVWIYARRRGEAVDGTGPALWCRRRTADDRTDLHDLLR